MKYNKTELLDNVLGHDVTLALFIGYDAPFWVMTSH